MMKCEFEERLGYEISNEEYNVIELVYTWHPAFDHHDTPKDAIVNLYKEFGMGIINGMVEIAELTKEITDEEIRLNQKRYNLKQRRKKLADGDTSVERDIKKIGEIIEMSDTPQECEERLLSAGFTKEHDAIQFGNYEGLFRI